MKKLKGKQRAPPCLRKRFSFQDLSANSYLVDNLEYDLMGDAMFSPSSKAVFTFQEESEVDGPTKYNINLPNLS